jgi:hypothetical protein
MAKASDTSPARPTDREELHRHFTSVFEDIVAYLAEQDDRKRDDLREQLEPLCVMRRIEFKVQLAWGGPEYGFKLYFDPECREWVGGVFFYCHWFTYEDVPLSPDELEKAVEAYSLDGLA